MLAGTACKDMHLSLAYARANIECASARDGEWACSMTEETCPYANHRDRRASLVARVPQDCW